MTLFRSKTAARETAAIVAALLVATSPSSAFAQPLENSDTPLGQTQDQMADFPPVSVRSLSYDKQLAWAGLVALDHHGSISVTFDEHTYVVTPAELVWRGDTAVLITSATMPDACHNCSGYLGVYYLAPGDSGFVLEESWPQAVGGTDWGGPPVPWRVTTEFGDDPVIYATHAGIAMGIGCSAFSLTELRAGGPAPVAYVPLSYSDEEASTDGPRTVIEGEVTDILPGRSFAVRYSGTHSFTDRYIRRDGEYVLQGEQRMRSC